MNPLSRGEPSIVNFSWRFLCGLSCVPKGNDTLAHCGHQCDKLALIFFVVCSSLPHSLCYDPSVRFSGFGTHATDERSD